MEFGPRALGSRSIIGDPRSPQMQQTLNLKVKFRESFRPFAPSVLRDHAHEIFQMEPDEDGSYMLTVAPVREKWRRELSDEEQDRLHDPDLRVRVAVARSEFPAITHVDYSARVQTVDERHGIYHRLLQHFYERTGCPLVVNTSFNVRGEPIVCTPEEAYACFTATDIDCLVIGHHVLVKEEQDPGSLQESERYRAGSRSTDGLSMLLPIDPTRYWHRSLCFVFAGIALFGGVLIAVLTTPIVGIAGLVISALFVIASVRADGAYRLYHTYNVVTAVYARLMRGVAQAACFAIVASARLTGTSLVVALPGSDSMWTPKSSLPADAYVNPYAFSSVPGGRGWTRGYITVGPCTRTTCGRSRCFRSSWCSGRRSSPRITRSAARSTRSIDDDNRSSPPCRAASDRANAGRDHRRRRRLRRAPAAPPGVAHLRRDHTVGQRPCTSSWSPGRFPGAR